MSPINRKWYVCRVEAWEGEEITLTPLACHAARQFATDDMLARCAKKDGHTYVIVDRDEDPPWEAFVYARAQAEVPA
jgi:hypothetical protein